MPCAAHPEAGRFRVSPVTVPVFPRMTISRARRAVAAGDGDVESRPASASTRARRWPQQPRRPTRARGACNWSIECAPCSARRSSLCPGSRAIPRPRKSWPQPSPAARRSGRRRAGVYTWFTRYARVREPLARLHRALPVRRCSTRASACAARRAASVRCRANNGSACRSLRVTRCRPARCRWSCSATTLDFSQPLRGLWIDEWIEIVPSREETTAITFQYNPPDACAPQSHAARRAAGARLDWTVGTLHRVLAETLDLAKLRAVDSEALGLRHSSCRRCALPSTRRTMRCPPTSRR